MATFDVAKLLNKITQDIPGINTVIKALAKWDVSALTDVPDGAMQATTDTNNRLTIKKKVSGSYTPVAKLMHDVDRLDGYHASASATANAVAVRNAQGALPGNITGNAATATTANALAAGTVVALNQGGTGATTASQARTNLGVAGSADFTAHIAKQSSPTVEGHVKLDALAADGSNTAAPGGFGLGMPLAAQIPANTDLDTVVLPGFYSCKTTNTATTLTNCPVVFAFSMFVEYGAYGPTQTITSYNSGARFQRTKSSPTTFGPWRSLPNGITDSTSTTSSTIAASATAVKTAYDLATLATGQSTARTDNLSIYISKTGNDSNSGLTAAQAVATWNRAQDIAASLRWSRGTHVIFRFGPGDWGNLGVHGVQFGVSHVHITSFSDTVGSATTLDDLPTFGLIQFYSCRGTVYNIVADQVTASDSSYVWVGAPGGYCRIARMTSSNASTMYITQDTTIDVVDAGGSSVFYAGTDSCIRLDASGVTVNFVGVNYVTVATVHAEMGSCIHVRVGGSYSAFTGTAPVGAKARAAFGSVIVINGSSYTQIPGTLDILTQYGGRIVDNTGTVAGGDLDVGDITASFAASKSGSLLMNGSAVSRTTYARLFALIGTTFGAGNGTTTFNLPDARGRTMQGANGDLMALLAAGLPNISGYFTIRGNQVNTGPAGGAFYKTSGGSAQNSSVEGGRAVDIVNIDASRSSSIYGNSNTVQSPAIAANYFLKY